MFQNEPPQTNAATNRFRRAIRFAIFHSRSQNMKFPRILTLSAATILVLSVVVEAQLSLGTDLLKEGKDILKGGGAGGLDAIKQKLDNVIGKILPSMHKDVFEGPFKGCTKICRQFIRGIFHE